MTTLTAQLPIFTRLDRSEIEELRHRDRFLWVDLCDPSTLELNELGDIFGFHPLAIDDTRSFGQRPKLDDYGDHLLLVFYGARLEPGDEPHPVEVHLFVSGGSVVTVHREPSPELTELRRRFRERTPANEQCSSTASWRR